MAARRTRERHRRRTSTTTPAPSWAEPGAYNLVRDAERRWGEEWRVAELEALAGLTANLKWSRALFLAVLAELSVGDDFRKIVGDPEATPPSRYPQAVAVAIAIRRSRYPGSLDDYVAALGLGGTGSPARRAANPTRHEKTAAKP